MFRGSTVDMTAICSSVVMGLSPFSHCSVVAPSGWLTQAFAHWTAMSRAFGAGGAEVGVCTGAVCRLDKEVEGGAVVCPGGWTAPPPEPEPGLVTAPPWLVLVVPPVSVAPLWAALPVSLGTIRPTVRTIAATTRTVATRWRGERIG